MYPQTTAGKTNTLLLHVESLSEFLSALDAKLSAEEIDLSSKEALDLAVRSIEVSEMYQTS